ncbi:MAG: isoprenyl transferase [Micropepsaceae bacterium]
MSHTAPEQNAHQVPNHIAIIMDGNGRWAKARHLPRLMGHRAGVAAVRATVGAAAKLGVNYLTLFGFSSENWKRSQTEVNDLMGLLRMYIRSDLEELHQNGVEIRIIGAKTRLEGDILNLIDEVHARTRGNQKLKLTIAFNYGGQDEIIEAVRQIAEDVEAGRLHASDVTREEFAIRLATAGMPDPDLVIRTSGEQRLSNFLLWQTAYSEFVFMDTLWPDFSELQLAEAIRQYQSRDRRFGGRNLAAGA